MNFFKKEDPKQLIRANDRQIRNSGRTLANDSRQLERREKELELEIKKLAKSGQVQACKVLAKQLVQLRQTKQRNTNMSAQLTAVGSKTKTLNSMNTMANAVADTTRTMQAVGKQMPIEKLAGQMREFAETNARTDMVAETLDDMMDDMFEVDEGETDAVIDRVLDEIGIDTRAKLPVAPRGVPGLSTGTATSSKSAEDKELDELLQSLRN